MSKKQKTSSVLVRMTPELHEYLKNCATTAGISVSELLRQGAPLLIAQLLSDEAPAPPKEVVRRQYTTGWKAPDIDASRTLENGADDAIQRISSAATDGDA